MDRPLISVVLCSYQGAKFLAAQIDSILNQTYRPLELIISDDASDDNTREVLKPFEAHPSVKIFYHEKNRGIAKNFAFAAAQATGDLIAFSDQDDTWVNHKLASLYDAIGEGLLVYSNSELVNEAGDSLGKRLTDIRRMYSGNDSRGYIFSACVWGHGMLIRRKLLELACPMPVHVHHDVWLAFMALVHGGIRYHDEVLTLYRQHAASSSITLLAGRHARTSEKKYADYKKQLRWIQLVYEHERSEYKHFYKKLLHLYAQKENRFYVWSLVFFMLRYRKYFFMFSKKSLASNIIDIFKHARGVRKPG